METTIIKVIHLQRLEMFEDIPSDQLAQIADISREVYFDENEVIYEAADTANSMFILLDGEVKITREGVMTRKIGKDEAFGIWGCFDQNPRLYTARSLKNSYLLKIDSNEFFDLIEDRIHVSRGLIKFLVKKIRRLITVGNHLV